MPVLSIYKNTDFAEERSPYSLIDGNKYRRYELCLGFVQTIIGDYFPAAENEGTRELFYTLGTIACCIDTHLDDLDTGQKEILLTEFPGFFDALEQVKSEEAFAYHLSALCTRLGTSLYPPSAASLLYGFYVYCRQRNMLKQLKEFSLAVICSGIDKSRASSAKEILACLAMEGGAAIHFLLQLLQAEKVIDTDGKKLLSLTKYLQRLERMLNIADDLADGRKDKKRGTITLPTNAGFYFVMGSRLFKTFFVTLAKNNLRFLRHFTQFTGRDIFSELR